MNLVRASLAKACGELDQYNDFDVATAGRQRLHLDDGDVCLFTIKDHATHMASVCVVLTWVRD